MTQELRFEQLMKVAAGHRDFCINDYGCGYGALLIMFLLCLGREGRIYGD